MTMLLSSAVVNSQKFSLLGPYSIWVWVWQSCGGGSADVCISETMPQITKNVGNWDMFILNSHMNQYMLQTEK